MSMKYTLRFAKLADTAELLAIYAPFVASNDRALSDVSFEYEVPSVAEFTERIKNISAAYPYIVCEHDGRLLGYVYAHPYIQRAAYQWGAEVTIYLAPEWQGRGLGKVMYAALEALLRLQGVVVTYACITASNEHSVKMHEACGYKIIGIFNNTGFKHGHWLDMVWMEKVIAEHPKQPALIKKIGELPAEVVAAILRDASAKPQ
ncbi:GNAT family N-acetyltransferase [uncultured Phascolarctobacterium sp.]|uniref:GNAT family N-acetyltransferase n=1 Tax=uncultured Phascolarctobacterium sp. TaxID=512296 RepID=UPI00262F33BB|nr:GNAT family N-acetyltransferase [uncultured Phascolarctobacterium sp.]